MFDTVATALDPSVRAVIFGGAVGFMALEYGFARLALHDAETHDLRETAASFGVALAQKAVKLAEAGLAIKGKLRALFAAPGAAIGPAAPAIPLPLGAPEGNRA